MLHHFQSMLATCEYVVGQFFAQRLQLCKFLIWSHCGFSVAVWALDAEVRIWHCVPLLLATLLARQQLCKACLQLQSSTHTNVVGLDRILYDSQTDGPILPMYFCHLTL